MNSLNQHHQGLTSRRKVKYHSFLVHWCRSGASTLPDSCSFIAKHLRDNDTNRVEKVFDWFSWMFFVPPHSDRSCPALTDRLRTRCISYTMLELVNLAVGLLIALWVALNISTFVNRWRTRQSYGVGADALVVGFFHPFCAGGGGGERVLWRAVRNLAQLSKDIGRPLHVLIYTGDRDFSPEQILSGVSRQFKISIEPTALPISFVYLRGRWLLRANLYPILTMLAQSVASMLVASEALARATPDVFVDTTGFAFTFPVAWLACCRVGAYVHYPTISTVSSIHTSCVRKWKILTIHFSVVSQHFDSLLYIVQFLDCLAVAGALGDGFNLECLYALFT